MHRVHLKIDFNSIYGHFIDDPSGDNKVDWITENQIYDFCFMPLSLLIREYHICRGTGVSLFTFSNSGLQLVLDPWGSELLLVSRRTMEKWGHRVFS